MLGCGIRVCERLLMTSGGGIIPSRDCGRMYVWRRWYGRCRGGVGVGLRGILISISISVAISCARCLSFPPLLLYYRNGPGVMVCSSVWCRAASFPQDSNRGAGAIYKPPRHLKQVSRQASHIPSPSNSGSKPDSSPEFGKLDGW